MPVEKPPSELTQAEMTRRIAETATGSIADRSVEDAVVLEYAIREKAQELKDLIAAAILKAAEEGKFYTSYEYSERISASRNSAEKVADIKEFADSVSQAVVAGLEADGYQLELKSVEVVDYRDNIGTPPEYYDTFFEVSWQREPTDTED